MSPTAVKEEEFKLNQETTGLTERDLTYAVADGGLQVVFEYAVPTGMSFIFRQEDTFAAYLEDDGVPAECVVGTEVDIVVMDSAKQNSRSLLNKLRYGNIKDFTDADKLVHLDIPKGEYIIAKEGERICIRVNNSSTSTIDASVCYWVLTCKRIRHTLFE